jgi:hypothetical protein
VERAVAVTAARLTAPLVTDLRVRAEGVRLLRQQPEGAQDVFAGQDLVLFAQVEGSGAATLVFSGRTADGPVEWRERVTVPARESGNAFVGKLWATQRVGWLSAARRGGAANAETDAELRQLGERWSIPTELTSYLVLEPGMTRSGAVAAPAPARAPAAAPATASADAAFESARASSAMREMKSLRLEQVVVTGAGSADERRIGRRRFERRGEAWVDAAYRPSDVRRVVTVQPYSPAWFALAEALGDLKDAFALGDRVTVAGRRVAIVVAPEGVTALPQATVAQIVQDW